MVRDIPFECLVSKDEKPGIWSVHISSMKAFSNYSMGEVLLVVSHDTFPFLLLLACRSFTFPLLRPQTHPARIVRRRMRCRLLNLIRAIAAISLQPLPRMRTIPLVIAIAKVELAHRAGQQDTQLRHHQALRYAIAGPVFEGAPRAFHGIELVAGLDEPAFGKEVVRSHPVFGSAVHAAVVHEADDVVGGADSAFVVDQRDAFEALAAGTGGWVESERLFDDGGGVGEVIREVGFAGESFRDGGDVGAEDGVVLGADAGQCLRVLGEQVEAVADGAAGGIVASEDEKADLADGERFEVGI